jgi:hypothetical protein
LEIDMPSDSAIAIDFVPSSHGVIDRIRVRLALWLLRVPKTAATRRRPAALDSLDARTLYDIGETDIVNESAVYSVAHLHPHILVFGGPAARRHPRPF